MLLKLQDNTLQYGTHIQSNCCQAQTDSKAETVSGPAHAETLVTVLSLFFTLVEFLFVLSSHRTHT